MRRDSLSILKACSYIFYLKWVFGSHVTWNSAVPDPNVWCYILLFLYTLDESCLGDYHDTVQKCGFILMVVWPLSLVAIFHLSWQREPAKNLLNKKCMVASLWPSQFARWEDLFSDETFHTVWKSWCWSKKKKRAVWRSLFCMKLWVPGKGFSCLCGAVLWSKKKHFSILFWKKQVSAARLSYCNRRNFCTHKTSFSSALKLSHAINNIFVPQGRCHIHWVRAWFSSAAKFCTFTPKKRKTKLDRVRKFLRFQ